MNRLIRLDRTAKTFECEPGYRFGELQALLKDQGLFFPPDPSSGEYATFGGMLGTNASGSHSVKYGNVADYFEDAEVVLATGDVILLSEIMERTRDDLPENLRRLAELYEHNAARIQTAYPDTPYNSAGYNLRGLVRNGQLDLRRLLAGAEGTLGIVTRLIFRLRDRPPYDSLVVAYMDDIVASAKATHRILPMNPSGIEVMDRSLLRLACENEPALRDAIPQDIDNVLLIEFDSFEADGCKQQAEAVRALLKSEGFTQRAYLAVSAEEKERFWTVRKAAVPILYKMKGRQKILALIEDAAVPIRNLVPFFQGIYRVLERHGVTFVIVGHIAKGLLHTRPLLDLKDPRDVGLLQVIADEFYEMVRALDGTVSGEHGDGRLRSAYIKRRYPEIYPLFLEIKALLDPEHRLNPEIITHHAPDQMARSLRYGSDYRSRDPERPRLKWDQGFIEAIEKCHGCSKCTTVTTATRMCPIYKFTRDEAASPKAKANVLRILISGHMEDRELYTKAFQAVMQHCVNCGSCHYECPSNVNIPQMALEARTRYAEKFGAPLTDHLLAKVELAGRFTHPFSPLMKPVMALAPARALMEKTTGISAKRQFVAFAARPLYNRVRPRAHTADRHVLYFAGCYASYIRPEIGQAAIRVLEHLGLSVTLPPQHCCGLPLLSKGMAGAARAEDSRQSATVGTTGCRRRGHRGHLFFLRLRPAARMGLSDGPANRGGDSGKDHPYQPADQPFPGPSPNHRSCPATGLSHPLPPQDPGRPDRLRGSAGRPRQRPYPSAGNPLLRHGRQLGHDGRPLRPQPVYRRRPDRAIESFRRRSRRHRLPHLPPADGRIRNPSHPAPRGDRSSASVETEKYLKNVKQLVSH